MGSLDNMSKKLDLLFQKINLGSTVKTAGKEIPPAIMGVALIFVCVPIWGYLEFEGQNNLIGVLVVILMAWGVNQLGAMNLGDGIGEEPSGHSVDKTKTIGHPTHANKTESTKHIRLARLAFAGVMIALAALYLTRNIDRYESLNIEFRFNDLVELVEPIQDTVEASLLAGSASGIDFLDSGYGGLPDEALVTAEAHGVSVIDGQIIATWMHDGSDLHGATYILTPIIKDGEVEWATTGTCGGNNAC